jgi:SAM-dependent methyltransferase
MIEQHPNWDQYAKVIRDKCFDCILPEYRVLEVGAHTGAFSKLILEKTPAFVELVEPDPQTVKQLLQLCNGQVVLRNESIFNLLPTYNKGDFDVVVAFGVLYHWSSPFNFLEQIVNNIGPKYICLDNPNNDQIVAKHEDLNISGNLFTDKRAVGISLHLPPALITQAMENLGYKQLLKRQMGYFQVPSKEQSWLWKFERI